MTHLKQLFGLVVFFIAGGLSALALDLPQAPAPPEIPDRIATLQAPSDGVTDATAAINAAIASLAKQGGGTLEIPAGTYLVSVNSNAPDYVIGLQSNIRLMGSTSGTSKILLAAHQAAYNTILGAGSYLSDVDIENLTVDLNGQNNPITSTADYHAGVRAAVRNLNGARMRIAYCAFQNAADINVIYLNETVLPSATVTDMEVAHNVFRRIGQPPGSFDYDHSTVYAHAVRVWVHLNTFSTLAGIGTPGGRTAIEMHGDDINASHNSIDSYATGFIITGQAASSDRQLYNGNVITNVINGMEMVSEFYDGSSVGLQNVTVENNQITLNANAWRTSGRVETNQPAWGIFLNPAPKNPAPIVGLAITGNTVSYPAPQGPATSGDTHSGGIVLWTSSGDVTPVSNLTISGNSITGALGPAIWTNIDLTGGTTIASNTIANPARSSDSAERTGVYVSATTSDIVIQKNSVTDSARPPLIASGVDAVSTCQSSCSASGNTTSPSTVPSIITGPGWTK